MKDSTEQNADRKAWMGLIAKAPAGRVATLLDDAMARPGFTWLRPPEQGSVMVQGRMGATGAPFNLGEMTVTRCALTLTTGEAGHAYIQGRSKEDAEACAMVDALMQTGAASLVKKSVIDPIQAELSRTRTDRQAKAAATKVDFFTMVRGEDQ
jgi:alpha-D-ribose 1-methylphosphonate 5-triphosphate synthase subunit PhnG